MTAYMDLNGIPATGNRWLFTEILRDTLGFEGFVVSDANAVRNLVTHGFAADLTDAGARALQRRLRHGDGDRRSRLRGTCPRRSSRARSARRSSTRACGGCWRPSCARALRAALRRRGARPRGARRPRPSRGGAHRRRALGRAAAQRGRRCSRSTAGASASRCIGPLADSRRDTLGPWVLRLRPRRDRDRARRPARAGRRRVEYAPGVRPAQRVFPSMFDMFGDNAPEDPVGLRRRGRARAGGRRSRATPTSPWWSWASGRT